MRCHYLAAYLKEQGVYVTTYKVPDCEDEYSSRPMLSEAFRNDSTVEERVLLLPVPVAKDGIHINGCTELAIENIARSLTAFDFVCGECSHPG